MPRGHPFAGFRLESGNLIFFLLKGGCLKSREQRAPGDLSRPWFWGAVAFSDTRVEPGRCAVRLRGRGEPGRGWPSGVRPTASASGQGAGVCARSGRAPSLRAALGSDDCPPTPVLPLEDSGQAVRGPR